jgi:hypothetical protein
MESNDEPRKPSNTIVDTIDAVIEDAGEVIGGAKGQKIAGGAAVGALAAIVLPVSLVTGALIGGVYAAWRQSTK